MGICLWRGSFDTDMDILRTMILAVRCLIPLSFISLGCVEAQKIRPENILMKPKGQGQIVSPFGISNPWDKGRNTNQVHCLSEQATLVFCEAIKAHQNKLSDQALRHLQMHVELAPVTFPLQVKATINRVHFLRLSTTFQNQRWTQGRVSSLLGQKMKRCPQSRVESSSNWSWIDPGETFPRSNLKRKFLSLCSWPKWFFWLSKSFLFLFVDLVRLCEQLRSTVQCWLHWRRTQENCQMDCHFHTCVVRHDMRTSSRSNSFFVRVNFCEILKTAENQRQKFRAYRNYSC